MPQEDGAAVGATEGVDGTYQLRLPVAHRQRRALGPFRRRLGFQTVGRRLGEPRLGLLVASAHEEGRGRPELILVREVRDLGRVGRFEAVVVWTRVREGP